MKGYYDMNPLVKPGSLCLVNENLWQLLFLMQDEGMMKQKNINTFPC